MILLHLAKMDKIAGGFVLQCGHRQVVSDYRVRFARDGQEQHSVWCVECGAWSSLLPFDNTIEDGEIVEDEPSEDSLE